MARSKGYKQEDVTAKNRGLYWSKVDKGADEECWEWQSPVGPDGYGRFSFHGRSIGSHQFAYLSEKGDILPGQVVRHDCNNKKCCNPKHLSLGSQLQNVQDRVDAGRTVVRGVVLTEEQVLEIREKWSTGNYSTQQLATLYGMSYTGMSRVVQRRTWKHL